MLKKIRKDALKINELLVMEAESTSINNNDEIYKVLTR
jgi:hypothetical protein